MCLGANKDRDPAMMPKPSKRQKVRDPPTTNSHATSDQRPAPHNLPILSTNPGDLPHPTYQSYFIATSHAYGPLDKIRGVMAAAMEVSPPASPVATKHVANDAHTPSCPSCGSSIDTSALDDARQRIEELEAQMERLKEKATAAGT